jgi:hypothetical protein
MRKSALWRLLLNIARATLFFTVCIALLVSAARADSAACLRILNYSNTPATPYRASIDGVLTLLADTTHGRVVRETRFPARTEVSFSPVANRSVYVAADVARPNTATLIVQGKSGIFSEDQIVQRGMVNDYFEYFSQDSRRMIWSQDGTRLAYLWRTALDPSDPRAGPLSFSVLNVETGEQQTTPINVLKELCCLGSFSPDLNYLSVRQNQFPSIDLQLWSTKPLQSADNQVRWLAGAWLPNSTSGHEFIGIGYPTTPSEMHFMRWSDTLKVAIPVAAILPRRLVLAAYPSPDGKYIAFQSSPTLCTNSANGCNLNYIFDIFTSEGELVGSDLLGLQTSSNRATGGNSPEPTPNVVGWSPDSQHFYYLYESFPQDPLASLFDYDLNQRQAVAVADDLASAYMTAPFFPDSYDRYYNPTAVQQSPPFMLRFHRKGSTFSAEYVALDGSKTIPLIDDVNLISGLESPYNGYQRLFGWGLDGRTIIIPWVRSGFNIPTTAGVVWLNAEGTAKKVISGLENVNDVNVAVDMTTRLASRWIGLFGARKNLLYFDLVNMDDERHWQVELPPIGSLNSWTTWFSRDGRYVAAYVGDAQGGGRRANLIYLIDLVTGKSQRFDEASMAAWARDADRLAVAMVDPVTGDYKVQLLSPSGEWQGTISLASFEVTSVRAMSWNPCR